MQASAISEYSRAGSGFVTFLPSWECHWSVSSSILHSASYYNAELAGWCNLRERETAVHIYQEGCFNGANSYVYAGKPEVALLPASTALIV